MTDKIVSDTQAKSLRALVKWIKGAKNSIDEQVNSALAESEQLGEFIKFLGAVHPMSSEVAKHIQQITSTTSTVIIKSSTKTATISMLFKLLEQVQGLLELFSNDDPFMEGIAAVIQLYAGQRQTQEAQEVLVEEVADTNDTENRNRDNSLPINVIPIKLEQQEMNKVSPSSSEFAPDMFYRFELPSTDTRLSNNLPSMSTMLNPANMEIDDIENSDLPTRSSKPDNRVPPTRSSEPDNSVPPTRSSEPDNRVPPTRSSEPDNNDIPMPEPESNGPSSRPPQSGSNGPSNPPAERNGPTCPPQTETSDLPARSLEPESNGLSYSPQPQVNDRSTHPTEQETRLVEKSKQTTRPASVTQPKYKRKPTPDHYQFGIIRYWKDAAPEIQRRIEECFERMERQTKDHSIVDITPSRWNAFFWVPAKGDCELIEKWPPMIQEMAKKLPKPTTFSIEDVQSSRYARFRMLHNKLRAPKMLAAAWERTHTIYPNTERFPELNEYINGRRSRMSHLRKLWSQYSVEVKELVLDNLLPWEVIADRSVPIPPKHQHPWDPVDPDNLEVALEIADSEEPVRTFYTIDLPERPQPKPAAEKTGSKRRKRGSGRITKRVRFTITNDTSNGEDDTEDDGSAVRL